MNRKLLWVGDAGVSTGFARVTHHVLQELSKTWEVHVLGLNYLGDPHEYPYPIYPPFFHGGGDPFGVDRLPHIVSSIKPDVVVLQNDPWNIPEYMERVGKTPVVGFVAVDGKNCLGQMLNGLATCVFWTQFGLQQARAGGYSGPAKVVPLGVDLGIYRPAGLPRQQLLRALGLPNIPEGAFIVGNVNRNQPRKRLDLTISYFAEWVKAYKVREAFLYLHVAPTGDVGYDVLQLMGYYGLSNRLIVVQPSISQSPPELMMAHTYNVFDLQVSTTQGEGWGLTTMEGMACGVPQIIPEWSALGEWPGDAASMVRCTSEACTPNRTNTIGGIPDRDIFIQHLNHLYENEDMRQIYRVRGLSRVSQPEYRWPAIGQAFGAILENI